MEISILQSLIEVKKEIKDGWVSPTFKNTNDAIVWLRDPSAKYANQLRKKV